MEKFQIPKEILPSAYSLRSFLRIFEFMKAMVITPKNEEEFNFLTKLLQKLNIGASTMTQEEMEDIGLSKMLKDVDKGKKVSKESVLKKLKV